MIKKIVFNTNSIASSLSTVASVVNSKNTVPILSNILLCTCKEPSGDGSMYMYIVACDGEMWIKKKVQIESESNLGVRVCVDAKSFTQAIGNLSGKLVTLEINDATMNIKGSYLNGYFNIPFLHDDNYPRPQACGDGKVSKSIAASSLYNAIGRVSFATANEELRPVLNGIHFDFFSDGMVAVATDAHRLAKYKDLSIRSDEAPSSITLPKKPCKMLNSMFQESPSEDVLVTFDDKMCWVVGNDYAIMTRLTEGNYPNYERVIPQGNDIAVDVKKESLVNALRRISPMTSAATGLITLSLNKNLLVVSCVDLEYQKSAKENIECAFDGTPVEISFEVGCLQSIIQCLNSEDIRMAFKDAIHAGLIYEATPSETYEYTTLIMPMKA